MAGLDIVQTEAANSGLILVLNSGSSSLKFGVYQPGESDETALLTGSAEGIAHGNGTLLVRSSDGTTILKRENVFESQADALAIVADVIHGHVQNPVAVGHRIVHGGPKLRAHQRITPQVLEQLHEAEQFAPLHIPQSLELVSSAQKIFPSAVHFACFDTAFHQTIPDLAAHLPIPQRFFDAGIRRYGFHGLSYESLVHHFGAKLPERAIFAHLGSGASLCALRNGRSIDTTMGLTPTGGIPMGTRCGDLDPGVILYLLRNQRLNADELEELLNHASGLFGLAGESDMKRLEERRLADDSAAVFALEVFTYSIRKVIGSYMALLGGVDILVFTGGIGEHSEYIRSTATAGLTSFGLTTEMIQVVAADEEKQIARHCRALLRQK